jgi:hypothetical protein
VSVAWATLGEPGSEEEMLIAALACGMALAAPQDVKPKSRIPDVPSALELTGLTENGSMSVRCSTTSTPGLLTCSFSTLRLIVPSEAEIQKNIANLRDSYRKDPSLTSLFRKNCAGATRENQAFEHEAKTPEVKRAFAARRRMSEAMCACKTDECATEELLKMIAEDDRACVVRAFRSELELKQVGPGKWMWLGGPGPICNVVNSTTIEYDPSKIWNPTVTMTVLSVDAKDERCKGMASEVNVPTIYAFRPTVGLRATCPTIKMIP